MTTTNWIRTPYNPGLQQSDAPARAYARRLGLDAKSLNGDALLRAPASITRKVASPRRVRHEESAEANELAPQRWTPPAPMSSSLGTCTKALANSTRNKTMLGPLQANAERYQIAMVPNAATSVAQSPGQPARMRVRHHARAPLRRMPRELMRALGLLCLLFGPVVQTLQGHLTRQLNAVSTRVSVCP